MNKKWAFVIAIFVFLLDQITKYLVLTGLDLGEFVTIMPNFFDLVHITNKGVAFGMLAKSTSAWKPFLLHGAAIFVAIALFIMYKQLTNKDRLSLVAIGLLWGGIAGNVLDRIRFGSVVDFIAIHYKDSYADFTLFGKHFLFPLAWPAFNVADSAITIAVIFLFWLSIKHKEIGEYK